MDIAESIAKASKAIDAALAFPLDTLQGEGVTLLALLSVLAFIMAGYRTMLHENPNIRSLVSQLVVTAAGIGLMAWVVGSGFGLIFVEGIDGSIGKAADMIFPGANSSDTMVLAGEAWLVIYTAVSDGVGRIYEGAWALEVLTVTAKNIGALAGLVIALVMVALNIMAFFSLQILSVMLLKLALLIAPLFLPWLLFSQTSFLAASWLRFFLSASLLKLLGAGLLMMSVKMVQGISDLLTPDADPVTSFFAALILSGVMLSILYVAKKIPEMSRELVSAGVLRGGL